MFFRTVTITFTFVFTIATAFAACENLGAERRHAAVPFSEVSPEDRDLANRLINVIRTISQTYERHITEGYFFSDKNIEAALASVKILLHWGANPNQIGTDGETALHVACKEFFDIKIIELLLACGGDIHVQNNTDATPLHEAYCCTRDATVLIKELITRGADTMAVNAQGLTPLLAKEAAMATASAQKTSYWPFSLW